MKRRAAPYHWIIIGLALVGCIVLLAMGKDGPISDIFKGLVGYAMGRATVLNGK
jgi:hypothetical protein